MTVKRKLFLAQITIIIALMLTTATYQVITRNVGQDFVRLGTGIKEVTEILQELRFAGLRIVSSTSEYMLVETMGGEIEDEKEPENPIEKANSTAEQSERTENEADEIQEAGENYSALMLRYRKYVLAHFPDEIEFVDLIEAKGQALMANSKKLREAIERKAPVAELMEGKEEFEDLEQSFLKAISAAITSEQKEAAEQEGKILSGISTVTTSSWIGFAALALFIAVFGNMVSRSIVSSLERLNTGVARIAKGDFETRLHVVGKDEIADLSRNFNHMAEELKVLNGELEQRVEERTAELHEMQKQLVKNERLSTLGQVTATMSHEIRNPLGAIRSSVYVIRETATALNLKLNRPLDRIERSVARCDNIVGDLLEYTRTKELDAITVDGCEYLNEILDEQVLPDTVSLVRELQVPGPKVNVDLDRFRRVIINLVDNAAQAIRDNEGERGEIVVSCKPHDKGSVISVRDNGPGMSADVLGKIFEPLFTTKSFGAGLGLPTVKQLVEQHNAELRVDTEVGVGTTFSIIMPHASAATAGPTETREEEKAA